MTKLSYPTTDEIRSQLRTAGVIQVPVEFRPTDKTETRAISRTREKMRRAAGTGNMRISTYYKPESKTMFGIRLSG